MFNNRGKLLVSLCPKTKTSAVVVEERFNGKSKNIKGYDATVCEKSFNTNVSSSAVLLKEISKKSENGGFDDTPGDKIYLCKTSSCEELLEEESGRNENYHEGYVATGCEISLGNVNIFLDQSDSVNSALDESDSTENIEICKSQAQFFVVNEADGSLTPLVTSNDIIIENINLDIPIAEDITDLERMGFNNLEVVNNATMAEGENNSVENASDFIRNTDSVGLVSYGIPTGDHDYSTPEVSSCNTIDLSNVVLEDNERATTRPTTSRPTSNVGLCLVNRSSAVVGTLTKEGNPRKRKKYELSVVERKKVKRMEAAEAHFVKGSCKENCKIKCFSKISENRQKEINNQYWELESVNERKAFILGSVSKMPVNRKTCGTDSRRLCTNEYYLKTDDGTSIKVCKVFFLNTLGYNRNNDKILQNLSKQVDKISPKSDGRKGKVPRNKVNHDLIIEHIESFEPKISHYRREHAPNRRYLPSDLSVTQMHQDFLKKFPDTTISYELYRSEVTKLNISFVKLGNEECEQCEHFNLHGHSKDDLQENCEVCSIWVSHIKKADSARTEYKNDAAKGSTNSRMVYSVDMEKVIMLPRCEMFKSVIFTKRLTVYNESFVPVGKKQNVPTVACLWHDATRGRNKEELISTVYKFLTINCRDVEHVVLWMDNCSSQNKNWAFYSFLVYCINCSEICTQTIEIKYFEPGHTFMSCDSFHHMVEKSLHRVKKIYDFEDFKQAVQSTSSKVKAIEMTPSDFFQWKDYSSKRPPNKGKKSNSSNNRMKRKMNPQKYDDQQNKKENKEESGSRPYMRDVVHIQARRGLNHLLYKAYYSDEEWKQLNFLTPGVLKNGLKLPPNHSNPVGISKSRKNGILKSLMESQKGIIPRNRFSFWENLPTTLDNE